MYTIPIIPPDLRHEETIIQAADALDVLQRTINSVFNQIDGRVQRNNEKLNSLGERIEKAQRKIRSLVGTKKAIKIFSPARFPATRIFRDIPQTFGDTASMQTNANDDAETTNEAVEIQSRVETATPQTAQEKLVFFHVRTKCNAPVIAAGETTSDSQRLAVEKEQTNRNASMGAIPEELRSVSALLVFSTLEPVYEMTTIVGGSGADPDDSSASWKRAKLFKNQRAPLQHPQSLSEQQKHQLLGPPPHSLVNRHQRMASPAGALRYTPKLNDAPDLIDLPLDLPDLPGIADDIHYEGEQQQTIAPSLYVDNLPELPELNDEQSKEPKTTATNIPKVKENENVSGQPKVELPPPPPPPPPAPTAMASAPPPPPPPPPPPAPASAALPSAPKTAQPKTASSDLRSELMDSIRKAGGARGGNLKASATDTARSDDVDGAKIKPVVGGDLMADLHNKLLMRRKGISGAKDITADQQQQSANGGGNLRGDSVISRLSQLIPPPKPQETTSDDDDEGDGNDDWID